MSEIYVPSVDVVTEITFPRLGLTDTGIVKAAREDYPVITDDYRLAGLLEREGRSVLNFSHLRPF